MDPSVEIHDRAVETLFEVFEDMCEGAISVDRNARVAWINDKYRTRLDVDDDDSFLGRDIEEIIPESLMREVVRTGKPIKALAPSVQPQRLTDIGKIRKWFKRNCKWTLGRVCTPQEKGDILLFLKNL